MMHCEEGLGKRLVLVMGVGKGVGRMGWKKKEGEVVVWKKEVEGMVNVV